MTDSGCADGDCGGSDDDGGGIDGGGGGGDASLRSPRQHAYSIIGEDLSHDGGGGGGSSEWLR